MTKIILLVIAFQVIAGILTSRKKKKQAEENARRMPSAGSPTASPAPAQPKPHTAIGRGHSEDEDEEEWDEHHMRDDGDRKPDTRASHRRLPDETHPSRRTSESAPATGPGMDKGKAAEMGKDLLTQLAKELGLELPTGSRPAPRPQPQSRPASVRPQPAAAAKKPPAKAAIQQTRAQMEKAANDRTTAMEKAARAGETSRTVRNEGENAPRRAPSNPADTPVSAYSSRQAPPAAKVMLMDVKSLRNAFILKTILDKPLALQPRRPGEG
jgi:hypothetical protein